MTSNLFEINFDKDKTKNTNQLGMREMQERVFEKRNSNYRGKNEKYKANNRI